jgi:catalase (peroxidase I)
MLYIGMERFIPENKKPKKINLTTKKKLLGWIKKEGGLNTPFSIFLK